MRSQQHRTAGSAALLRALVIATAAAAAAAAAVRPQIIYYTLINSITYMVLYKINNIHGLKYWMSMF